MQAIQNWCYTIFAGVLFSGIVLLLTPIGDEYGRSGAV